MTRKQAGERAHELWGRRQTPGVSSVGDRVGATIQRIKSTDPLHRCEVGYYEVQRVSPTGTPIINFVAVGRGASWDDALLSASRSRGVA